jgi:hypothetical protein
MNLIKYTKDHLKQTDDRLLYKIDLVLNELASQIKVQSQGFNNLLFRECLSQVY